MTAEQDKGREINSDQVGWTKLQKGGYLEAGKEF